MHKTNNQLMTVGLLILLLVLMGSINLCVSGVTKIKLTLDWTPNTNHTGVYVATEQGYFAEEELKVNIVQPSKTTAIQLTGSGRTEFGISHQEALTMARARGVPVVSIAAIIQENTSGFAAPKHESIESVKDFEGHRFGGWGSELYNKIIQSVMRDAGADFSSVKFVNIGMTDFITAARHNMADFFWIFYGWQGIHAKIEELEFNYIPAKELSDTFNYYTPILITSESMIEKKPGIVERFVRAVTRGYLYAENNPKKSAEILLKRAPELNRELVMQSQKYLSNKYSEGVEKWGFQEEEVWKRLKDWLYANNLIEKNIDVAKAYTNAFLSTDSS